MVGWGRRLKWFVLISLAFTCAWAFFTPRQATDYRRTLLECGMVMAFALLALPLAWAHYGIWLLPVIAILGASLSPTDPGHHFAVLMLVVAVICINFPVLPLTVVQRFGEAAWFRLAISHQFLGTVILLGLCIWRIRRGPDAWPSCKPA
jgi:hypothetical protein